MIEKNLYWVLSRVKFDIIKMPQINQTVVVETWPHPKGRIDFDRDIKILNEKGELLIIATSKWCVIDAKSRMLQRSDTVNYSKLCCDDKNYDDKFNKIIMPNKEMINKFNYIVRFSDLDHNRHMNNTNYANIITNAIDNKLFSHFEINFINECKEKDEILVYVVDDDENGEYICGKVNDLIVFNSFIR